MKTYLLKTMLLLSISNSCLSIHITEAIKKRWIKVETKWKIKAQEETSSLRHGSNLNVKVTNLSTHTLAIEIPSGTLFTAQDSTKQNMLVTENLQFDLLPRQSLTKYCTGYCCESGDGAPTDEDVYALRKPASEKLVKLAEFVNQKKYKGYGVQRAIWCISNNKNLSDISSGDSSELRQLIYFTGNLANYKTAEIEKIVQKNRNGGKDFEKLIALEIPVNTDATEVWIVIQNINNNTMQTIMTKQKPGKGMLKKQVGVSSIDLGMGQFVVRVYSTDKPVMEQKFTLKS